MKTPDTDKLVQALLNNEARHTMPREERERIVRETREAWEAMKKPIPLQVTTLFAISWSPCGPEFSCPRCKAGMERTTGLMMMSPWAGSVRCTQCDYRDSVTGYLGRSMVKVEPLPEGAVAANVGAASIREAEDARILEAMKEGNL